MIRERVPLANDTKHMLSFKKCYDRLFKEFKDKLAGEYNSMKTTYQSEYEQNFQANIADKNAHIAEIHNHITQKEEDISDKKELYDALKQKIFGLLR